MGGTLFAAEKGQVQVFLGTNFSVLSVVTPSGKDVVLVIRVHRVGGCLVSFEVVWCKLVDLYEKCIV